MQERHGSYRRAIIAAAFTGLLAVIAGAGFATNTTPSAEAGSTVADGLLMQALVVPELPPPTTAPPPPPASVAVEKPEVPQVETPVEPASTEGVGDCSGFVIPDYIIQRESGGDPHAVNSSSGAYGCTQIVPAWWAGLCSHLDRTTVEGQRECTQIIVDTQGMSAWALTR